MNKPLVAATLLSGIVGFLLGWVVGGVDRGKDQNLDDPAPRATTTAPLTPDMEHPTTDPGESDAKTLDSSPVLPALGAEPYAELGPPAGPLPALPDLPPRPEEASMPHSGPPRPAVPANAKALRRAVTQIPSVTSAEWETGDTMLVRAKGDGAVIMEQSCLVMRDAGQPVKIHLSVGGQTKLRQCW